jgi:hypothetical protein
MINYLVLEQTIANTRGDRSNGGQGCSAGWISSREAVVIKAEVLKDKDVVLVIKVMALIATTTQ